jgi:hypothetical protein
MAVSAFSLTFAFKGGALVDREPYIREPSTGVRRGDVLHPKGQRDGDANGGGLEWVAMLFKPAGCASAWRALELAKRSDWVLPVPPAALAEMEEVLAQQRALGHDSTNVVIEGHNLPNITELAAQARAALTSGYGFCLLRALPVDRYSTDELKMLLLVLGNHIGLVGAQEDRPRAIGEVMDTGPANPKDFYFQRGGPLPMHMDPIDVVGLLCVRKAKVGGESAIASSMTVHNAILNERPDLLELLYRGFHHIRRHAAADRGKKLITDYLAPVYTQSDGRDTACSFVPESILAAERIGAVALSPQEHEAVEIIEKVATRAENLLAMDLKPGDLQLLNNRVIFHSRLDYEDYPEMDRRRLMLRLWLTMPSWPKLPQNMPHFDVELGRRPA